MSYGIIGILLFSTIYTLLLPGTISGAEDQDVEILLVDSVTGWDDIKPRPVDGEIIEDPYNSFGNDVSQFYRDALDHNGFIYDEWKVFRNWDTEMPPLAQMKEYPIIVWFFGDSDPSMLSENPFAYEITRYLENGGNMLIVGNRALPYIASTQPSFQQDFLHASLSGNTSLKSIDGTTSDFIGDGLSFDIEGGDGADNNKGDCPILAPVDEKASTIFNAGASPVGIRTSTGIFDLIFLSFNFEAIHSSSTRDRVMQRIVYFLRGRPSIEHTPLRDTEDFHQDFNVTCDVRGMDLNMSSIQLVFYNGTLTTVTMERIDISDTFSARIPEQKENTTIEYYIKACNLEREYSFEPNDIVESDRSTYHSFFIGPDHIPPTFEPQIRKDTIRTDGYLIRTRVSDNIAVDPATIKLHYKALTDAEFTTVNMTGTNDLFTGEVNGFPKGTTVEYHFTAIDDANVPNAGRYPESGELSFEILYYKLLVVHASGVSSRVERIEAMLTDKDHDIFEADEDTMPSIQYLTDYSDVILDLGYNYLDEDGAQWVVDYLSDDHKVFLFGQNPIDPYTETQGAVDDLMGMLKVEFGYWISCSTIEGKDDDPIGDGLSFLSTEGMFSGIIMNPTDTETAVPFLFASQRSDIFIEDDIRSGADDVPVGVRVGGSGYRSVILTFDPLFLKDDDGSLLFDRVLKWLSAPSIEHEPLKDTEDTNGPFTISAGILDDDLDPALLDLHYRYEGGNDVKVDLETNDGKTYTATIPGKGSPSMIYYCMEASDLAGLRTCKPEKADPSKVETMYKFYSGPDTTPPMIEHVPLMDDFNRAEFIVNSTVTDNLGLGEVTLHWRKNGASSFTEISMTGHERSVFTAAITGTSTGDLIEYYIEAEDLASSKNKGRSPMEGYHSFNIVETMPVLVLDGSYSGILKGGDVESLAELYAVILEDMGISYHYLRLEYYYPYEPDPVPRQDEYEYTSSVDLDLLTKYETVFYIPSGGGDNWALLTSYLDAGGTLLIAPGLIWEYDERVDSYEISDYIGAMMNEYISGEKLSGIDGDLIGDGLVLQMEYDYAYSLELTEDFAIPFLTIQGEPCAVHVDHNGYRLVDLSFDPMYIENKAEAATLIERVYTFLSGVPSIDHEPHPDTEDTVGPYIITADVSDNDLDDDLVELHYSTGGSVETVPMSEVSSGTFEGEIPGQSKGTTVHYYITASDTSGNIGVSPYGARDSLPTSMYSFYVGDDDDPPEITYEPFRSSKPREDYILEAIMTDNVGIDLSSTKLCYRKQGENEFRSVIFVRSSKLNTYTATIPGSLVSVGDVIEYYVEVYDSSNARNSVRSPGSGFLSFGIVDRNLLVIGGEDEVSRVIDILGSNGYAFDIVGPGSGMLEGSTSLMGYTAVAWIAEPDSYDPLTMEEAEVLSSYMDRGGNVLLAGDHIAWAADQQGWSVVYPDDDIVIVDDDYVEPKPREGDIDVDIDGSPEGSGSSSSSSSQEEQDVPIDPYEKPGQDDFRKWLSEYFKVEYDQYVHGGDIEGTADDPIGDGISFRIQGEEVVWDRRGTHDIIGPIDDAVSIFTDGTNSKSVGVRYEGDHRSVFLSFSLSDVEEEEVLEQIVTRTVDHLYEGWDNIHNDPPELEAGENHRVKMEDGTYNFTVIYYDAENDPPSGGVFLVINSEKHRMSAVDPLDNNFIDGKEYFIVLKLEDGSFKYHFETASADPTSDQSFSTKESSSIGIPVFISAVVVLLFLLLVAVIIFLMIRRREQTKKTEEKLKAVKEKHMKEKEESQKKGEKKPTTPVLNGSKPVTDLESGTSMEKQTSSKCPFCDKVIPADADKCPECGSDLGEGLECPKCGSPIPEGAESCPKCGVKFG
ncbi:MAG: zinc ribbon domain-containing protein [Candidatus Thermoplasmatota archaeon]|nr:zinc ribbon domain-containing protein [Candidatus Thermoplasmatota archaeon]